jgi:hypothetical protein
VWSHEKVLKALIQLRNILRYGEELGSWNTMHGAD